MSKYFINFMFIKKVIQIDVLLLSFMKNYTYNVISFNRESFISTNEPMPCCSGVNIKSHDIQTNAVSDEINGKNIWTSEFSASNLNSSSTSYNCNKEERNGCTRRNADTMVQ